MVAPPTSLAPSTSAPSSSAGGVTLNAIMVQLQCIDARLDTLSDKLYQVNTRVSRITRQQAHLGGFMVFCQRISQLHKIVTYVPNTLITYVLTPININIYIYIYIVWL